VKGYETAVADVVVAVELCAVVQGGTVGAERTSDPDAAWFSAGVDFSLGVFAARLVRERNALLDRLARSLPGGWYGEADLVKAHCGELIACRDQAVGAGFQIAAMDG
jgi:hypothetical protein